MQSTIKSEYPVGEQYEYDRIHYAARKIIPEICARCGSSEAVQAALNPLAPTTHLYIDPKTGCRYSIDIRDYISLCCQCHRVVDLVDCRTHCLHGHEYTLKNTSIKPDGSRRCLACHREQAAKRLEDPTKRAIRQNRQREQRKPLTTEQRARKTELQRIRRASREHGR